MRVNSPCRRCFAFVPAVVLGALVGASDAARWLATHGMQQPVGSIDYAALQRMLYAHLQEGRYAKAQEVVEVLRRHVSGAPVPRVANDARDGAYYATDMLARIALERQNWNDAIALPELSASPSATTTLWYARGIAAARAARPDGNPAVLLIAQEAAARLDALAGRDGRRGLAEMERLAVLAAIAASQEEREEMTVLLLHAASLEDAMPVREHPPLPVIPIHELGGDLFLQVSRPRDAAREYTSALGRYPERARSLLGLARASAAAGDTPEAVRAYSRFLDLWKHADRDRPEVAEANAFLKKYPKD